MIGVNIAIALRRSHRVFGTYRNHRPELDAIPVYPLSLSSGAEIRESVRRLQPDIVVYCAAETDEHRCAADPIGALAVNAEAADIFARELLAVGGSLIYLSTSKVFSGEKGGYRETDKRDGHTWYGQTKIKAESLLEPLTNVVILRLGTVFGIGQFTARSFLNRLLRDLIFQRPIPLVTDELRSFCSVEEVGRLIRLLADRLPGAPSSSGIFHVGPPEKLSYHAFACQLAEAFALPTSNLRPIPGSELMHRAPGAARENDLSLRAEELTRTLGFQARSIPESLARLRFSLQNGKQ